ncbi:hypothetical protein HN51_028327 [Arachis hypogaea]
MMLIPERHSDAASPTHSATADLPASEPTSTRHRARALKPKASSLSLWRVISARRRYCVVFSSRSGCNAQASEDVSLRPLRRDAEQARLHPLSHCRELARAPPPYSRLQRRLIKLEALEKVIHERIDAPRAPRQWWFGKGTDLTPSYIFEDDVKHFHSVKLKELEAEYKLVLEKIVSIDGNIMLRLNRAMVPPMFWYLETAIPLCFELKAKFLKACGTLPGTPIEIWKTFEKLKVSPSPNKHSEPSKFHSWLPNESVEKLQLDFHSVNPQTPLKNFQELGDSTDSFEHTPDRHIRASCNLKYALLSIDGYVISCSYME